MTDSLNRQRWSGWCLDPSISSSPTDTQDPISEYRASLVAELALWIPWVRLTHSALPSRWDWRARWAGDGGSFDLAMPLLDDNVDPPSFGGFNATPTVRPSCSSCGWPSGASSGRSGYTRPIAASRNQDPLVLNSSEVQRRRVAKKPRHCAGVCLGGAGRLHCKRAAFVADPVVWGLSHYPRSTALDRRPPRACPEGGQRTPSSLRAIAARPVETPATFVGSPARNVR